MTKEDNIRAVLEAHFPGFREDIIESAVKMIMGVTKVRHGRWKETTTLNLWECSVCGQMIYSETVLDRKAFHKWCGKCGAKMDEVEE